MALLLLGEVILLPGAGEVEMWAVGDERGIRNDPAWQQQQHTKQYTEQRLNGASQGEMPGRTLNALCLLNVYCCVCHCMD